MDYFIVMDWRYNKKPYINQIILVFVYDYVFSLYAIVLIRVYFNVLYHIRFFLCKYFPNPWVEANIYISFC